MQAGRINWNKEERMGPLRCRHNAVSPMNQCPNAATFVVEDSYCHVCDKHAGRGCYPMPPIRRGVYH